MPRSKAVIVAGAVLAYSWWVTGLAPSGWTSAAAVVLSGVAAMVLGAHAQDGRQHADLRRGEVVTWLVPLGALAGWQLAAFLQHPRREHPTLSALAGALLEVRAGRTLAFALWLVGAAWLARR